MARIKVIFAKSLKDFFNLKTSVIYLGLILIAPLIFAIFAKSLDLMGFATMTLPMQSTYLVNLFLVMSFMWIAGFPLMMFTLVSCATFISKEHNEGTLLILVTKPVKRSEILLGKFYAFLAYTSIMQLVALLAVPYLWSIIFDLDLFVFLSLLKVVIPVYIYSLFIMAVFGSIASALSAITRNTVRTVTALIMLTVFIFFGFAVLRGVTAPVYDYIRYVDVNYHLGNTFDGLALRDTRMMPQMQIPLGGYSGLYDTNQQMIDFDQQIMAPSLQKNAFFSPMLSILVWIVTAVSVTLLGIFWLMRKEIY